MTEFGKTELAPTSDVKTTFDKEPEDEKTESMATGVSLIRGPFGFIRGAKAYLGVKLRFRMPKILKRSNRMD